MKRSLYLRLKRAAAVGIGVNLTAAEVRYLVDLFDSLGITE